MSDEFDKVILPAHLPRPLPSRLRSELTAALLANSVISNLQSTLYDGSRNAGWRDAVVERTKELIKNGEAQTRNEILTKLAKESRGDNIAQTRDNRGINRGHMEKQADREEGELEKSKLNVKFPEGVAKKGEKIIRSALDDITEFDAIRGSR